VDLGFTGDKTDDILAKSFGWCYSDYWSEEKQDSEDSVFASLALMQSLGVDMAALVTKFPEVMGHSSKELGDPGWDLWQNPQECVDAQPLSAWLQHCLRRRLRKRMHLMVGSVLGFCLH